MKVVIMGCGRVGARLASLLDADGHSVSVLDVDSYSFRRLPSDFKGTALLGNGVVAGRYWYYEAFTSRAFGVSRNARMGDGTKFEFVRDRDFVNNQLIINVSNAIIDEDKIPYTDAGAGQITARIVATLNDAAADGILDPTTIVVTTLPRTAQAPADIAAGKWLGFTWSATLLGSIDSVDIGGTLFITG